MQDNSDLDLHKDQDQPQTPDTVETSATEAVELTEEQKLAQALNFAKETYIYVAKELGKYQEPKNEMGILRDFLRQSLSNKRGDEEYLKFLHHDIGPGMALALHKETSNDEDYLILCGEIITVLIELFVNELKAKRYDAKFMAGMTYLFQHDAGLHRRHFQITQAEMKRIATAGQTWRADLKKGDKIDVLTRADERFSHKGWMQAQIVEVHDDALRLEYTDSSDWYDCHIDRYAVEIAQFETKTKDDYAWRTTKVEQWTEVDAHDKFNWCKATVLEIKSLKINEDRSFMAAYIGYRVYRENTASYAKSDEHGTYEGWSSKQDEWIPLISPRIAPWATKYKRTRDDEDEVEENFDDHVQPEAGFEDVYAIPRVWKCTSSLYIHTMNLFGNLGGFDEILELLQNAEMVEKPEDGKLDIASMGILSQCVSLPAVVYPKKFIAQHGKTIVECAKRRLLAASAKSLREVRKQQIDAILGSADNIAKRFMGKNEREQDSESLKLEMALKCVGSEYLEQRINGLRDLSMLIKNNTLYGTSKTFSTEYLVEWIKDNVLSIIWDPRKTHVQLVQRSSDIFRLLAREKALNTKIMQQIWDLATDTYKSDVLKFVGESAFVMEDEHKEFLVKAIAGSPPEKMTSNDFEAVCDLGRNNSNPEFSDYVFKFYFNFIQVENVKEDLTKVAIKKCSEMIKYSALERKNEIFLLLASKLEDAGTATLPIMRLFRKMIKDEKSRAAYSYNSYSNGYYNNTGANVTGYKVTSYGGTGQGTTGASKFVQSTDEAIDITAVDDEEFPSGSADKDKDEDEEKESKEPEQEQEKQPEIELTLKSILNHLCKEKELMKRLLTNVKQYFDTVHEAVKNNSVQPDADREKLFVSNDKFSHHQELQERLQFLQLVSSASDFKVTKVQLKVIYGLLQSSPINSDNKSFLQWCRQACKSSEAGLDLAEVGSFLSELISNKEMDLTRLPLVGFHFIQDYFLSLNQTQDKLKVTKKQVKVKSMQEMCGGWNYLTSSYSYQPKVVDKPKGDEDSEVPDVEVLVEPSELEQLELIWTVVLSAEDTEVTDKASDLLVRLHAGTSSDQEKVPSVIGKFVDRCIVLLKEQGKSSTPGFVKRVVKLLQKIIQHSELPGTNGVRAHNAILNGEQLDRIIIQNNTRKQQANLVVRVYTSATVWEFIQEVSYMLDLSPDFVKFKLPNKKDIKPTHHGMILQQLGLKNGDIIKATRIKEDEQVTIANFFESVPGQGHRFTDQALGIFDWMFKLYAKEETKYMDDESVVHFIRGCTGENTKTDDKRVTSMLTQYGRTEQGKLTREEFLQFFWEACADRGRVDRVYENLALHNIRADLVPIRDVQPNNPLARSDMPRYTMSAREDVFAALLTLLDRADDSTSEVWELIRMLSTNQKMFNETLQVEEMRDEHGNIQWNNLLENKSVYRKVYTFEIIAALLEEAESFVDGKRVEFVTQRKPPVMGNFRNNIPIRPADLPKSAEESQSQEVNFNDSEARAAWTAAFVREDGFKSVVDALLKWSCEGESLGIFDLKQLNFLVTLVKVFLVAAFGATGADQDFKLERQKSMEGGQEPDSSSPTKLQVTGIKKELSGVQRSLAGEVGQALVDGTNLKLLQQQLIRIISHIVANPSADEVLEEKNIVENSLMIWMACNLYDPALFEEFLKMDDFATDKIKTPSEFILTGVLYCPIEKIRKSFQHVLTNMAQRLSAFNPEVMHFLMKILSGNFAQISGYPSAQYFDLFNHMVDIYFQNQHGATPADIFDPESLLGHITDKIRADQLTQRTKGKQADPETEAEKIAMQEAEAQRERLMVGLIELTAKIISKVDKAVSEKLVQEKDLVNEIFKEFLFASVFKQSSEEDKHSKIAVKTKSRKNKSNIAQQNSGNKSRDAAYMLLNSLIKKSPNLMVQFIGDQLLPLMNLIKKPTGWKHQPASSDGGNRYQEYVGLVNLGCICYMNSMMQQFFMIPAFRYNLMCVDDEVAENLQDHRGEQVDDNLLHQMQKLMAHLELSERTAFNPKNFCFAFKEPDGTPTNTIEQKDAQEFLNLLFDRLETALKPTKRKYLIDSIFGGHMVNQMVCKECGKAKDKLDKFLTLSVTVQEVKTLQESLSKLIEGEVVSDYACSGCNRKVDISMRKLLVETPNVLIVHLTRLVFNFETFQNDKVNTELEFPQILDLSPYSYYHVMKKEGLIKDPVPGEGEGGEDGEPEPEVAHKGEKGKGDQQEEEEPKPVIIEDDCFEYKLAGACVHTGSANSGHYWSYINTERSDQGEGAGKWTQEDGQAWMEYNDSSVSDWNFSRLKEDCFGDDPAQSRGWGNWGGKSAYMLIYERVKKKPIKILVPKEELAAKDEGQTNSSGNVLPVHYDEETKEHYKLVPYSQSVDGDAPNEIYRKVFEDNAKFTFETDVYSEAFFNFIHEILDGVAEFDRSEASETLQTARVSSLEVAKKALFDILARCKQNQGMKAIVEVMCRILQSDGELAKGFLRGLFEGEGSHAILELLLDNTETSGRAHIAHLIKFLLAHVKLLEKDKILNDEQEPGVGPVYDRTGNIIGTLNAEEGDTQPASVAARFMNHLILLLPVRVARAWARFDEFLEIIYSFAAFTPEQILASGPGYTQAVPEMDSDSVKVGLHYFFSAKMLEKIGDFILEDDSPFYVPGETRPSMGSQFNTPDFEHIMQLFNMMMSASEYLEKFPLTDNAKLMFEQKAMLTKLLEPSGNKKPNPMVASMCHGNGKMTQKVAKALLHCFSTAHGSTPSGYEKVKAHLRSLKQFLRIDDEFKQHRLEWMLGVGEPRCNKPYGARKHQMQAKIVERASDEANEYKSALITSMQDDSVLAKLITCRGRQDHVAILALKDLIKLAVADDTIARYLFNQPPVSLANARFTDWLIPYLGHQREELEQEGQHAGGMVGYSSFQAERREALEKVGQVMDRFRNKMSALHEESMARMEEEQKTGFEGCDVSWMAPSHPEVMDHWPPAYILGDEIGDEKVIDSYEDDFVQVRLLEVTNEYIYSNPTGMYNLSLPQLGVRLSQSWQVTKYAEYREARRRVELDRAREAHQEIVEKWKQEREAARDLGEDVADEPEPEFVIPPEEPINVKKYADCKQEASCLLRVEVMNKHQMAQEVYVSITRTDPTQPTNLKNLSISPYYKKVYVRSTEAAAHIQKIDPSKPFDEVKMTVEVVSQQQSTTINTTGTRSYGRGTGGHGSIPGLQGLGLMTAARMGQPQHVQVIMQGGIGGQEDFVSYAEGNDGDADSNDSNRANAFGYFGNKSCGNDFSSDDNQFYEEPDGNWGTGTQDQQEDNDADST